MTGIDWPRIHAEVVAAFEAGWAAPGPHAWDAFLTPDAEFVQPMLRDGHGRELWWEEAGRLLTLLPDITGTVRSWAGNEETLFIAVRFDATLGGRPFGWDAVDELSLTPEGTVRRRESFFDSVQPAAQLATRPSAWSRWWRSGIGPLTWRRRVLRKELT